MAYKKSYKTPYKKTNKIEPGSQYKPIACPSDEQKTIISAIRDGSGSIIVDAYAGCGKTTLCVESMHEVMRKNKCVSQGYLIFAKRNKDEAVGKCPKEATVKTAHAFGLQALSASKGHIDLDTKKTERIAEALVGPDSEKAELRYMLSKAIDLGKDYLATTPQEIITIVNKHSMEFCGISESEFADKTLQGMEMSAAQPRVVSYSDMVWLPIKLGLKIPTFDLLYADEWQDLNRARMELVFRALGDKGRLIAVGDSNQAIYGFSGADSEAMQKGRERSGAATLPLHKTFRCGKAIVKMAQTYVPDYVAAETNSDGEVRDMSMDKMMADDGVGAGDFILSRTNAPCIKIAMQLLRQNRNCTIMGTDLIAGLLFMIKRSKAKDVASFQSWLEDWKNAEIERLTAKKMEYAHIIDKAACLEAFCEGTRDLENVKWRINDIFADTSDEGRVTLATIHKSKGLDRNRVWRLESSFVCKPKTEEDKQQERNVSYVSITRAKDSLYLVE